MPDVANRSIEILAPAGDAAAVRAAIAAGAGAVFLGLGELDARRGARGITPTELPDLVTEAHAAGTKIHLTLNITMGTRELPRAARTLAWAERCGVDAVLVTDPALLALMPHFPGLELHVSTQAGISSSAGVRAAAILGVKRVVLAREMSVEEIRPCCGLGPEIEVFAQGALCFSVSGRCSMTSWVGGRSGNRGTCTSICRVNWSCNGAAHGRPLDMRDNSAVRVVPELAAMGVTSLKIEGRLKTPQWVGQAVELYRRALAGEASAEVLWAEAEALGAYTGREMTDAWFAGKRVGLVHPDEGRIASVERSDDQDPPRVLTLRLERHERGLRWIVRLAGREHDFTTTLPSVLRRRRGADLGDLRDRLADALPEDCSLAEIDDAVGGLEIPRRLVNDVVSQVTTWIRRNDHGGIDRLKVAMPDAVRAELAPRTPEAGNHKHLNSRPDRARVDADRVEAFAAAVGEAVLVVEVRDAATVERLASLLAGRWIAALPPVIYQGDLEALSAACAACRAHGVPMEANGWDGWWLAREAGVAMEAGPGMAVLNAVAARFLAGKGITAVHVSCEADAGMLADCCRNAETPLIIQVFGRPALMTTRAWSKAPGWTMADARGAIEIAPRQEGPVIVLRPVPPFDWRTRDPEGVLAAHLEMDLSASPDPVAEWRSRPARSAHQFNLDRALA